MKTDLHISFTAIAFSRQQITLDSRRMEDESSFADFLSNVASDDGLDKVESVDLVMNINGLHAGSDTELLFSLNRVRLKGGKTAWRP